MSCDTNTPPQGNSMSVITNGILEIPNASPTTRILLNEHYICIELLTFKIHPFFLTLLHSERPKLYTILAFLSALHWLGAYRTNALSSGHIFVRFNDLEDVFM